MKKKNMIIIGAGVGGLSTGIYGQVNGFDTSIFELHTLPGGLCTSWKRKEFTFDGCIHWLVGSNPRSRAHAIWEDTGALDGKNIVNHDEFVRFIGEEGRVFILYTNVDRLEKHMKELSPSDSDLIEEFTGAIRAFSRVDFGLGAPESLPDRIAFLLKMVPLLLPMRRWSKTSTHQFASRFKDAFLKSCFNELFGLPNFPMFGMIVTLAWMHNQDAGYPVGGSLEFAKAMEKRYLQLGGEIHYRSRVEKILVENDTAVGVRLADGSEHRADLVVSAADGHATIFDMLGGKYINDTIRNTYDHWEIFQPVVQVSLGVNRDLSSEPASMNFPMSKKRDIAGRERTRMASRHLCYDPTLAPAGKSVVQVIFESNHAYWKELAVDEEKYESEKKKIALAVIEELDRRYPGFEKDVEVVDVATPLTTERYTSNWQGSIEGWMLTTSNMGQAAGRGMSQTLPGLANFYMAGQWVEPGGGIPSGPISARKLITTLCKREGRKFHTRP